MHEELVARGKELGRFEPELGEILDEGRMEVPLHGFLPSVGATTCHLIWIDPLDLRVRKRGSPVPVPPPNRSIRPPQILEVNAPGFPRNCIDGHPLHVLLRHRPRSISRWSTAFHAKQ